jgi:hypothetical protein
MSASKVFLDHGGFTISQVDSVKALNGDLKESIT